MFNRKKAIFFESMNKLSDVTITDDKVKCKIGWNDLDLKPEDVPKLLSDFIQIYALVKDSLDEKSKAEADNKDKEEKKDDLDLSDIPF